MKFSLPHILDQDKVRVGPVEVAPAIAGTIDLDRHDVSCYEVARHHGDQVAGRLVELLALAFLDYIRKALAEFQCLM